MKRVSLFLLAMGISYGQITYTASKTTALSGAAEVVTVQQAASSARNVQFVSAFVDCTVACTVTIERNGTAATATALTPAPANPDASAAVATAWSGSNVGTGTVITRASIPAGGSLVVDLSRIYFTGSGAGKNLSVRTNSITGTVDIVITWTEK